MRESLHKEPQDAVGIVRHYLGDLIYGANDGVITTFAVVAGVTGGSLSARTVLIVGVANLFADGLSMGVGNYLSIRSTESAREAANLPEEEAAPVRHALATLLAFVVVGAVPLAPYVVGPAELRFGLSVFLTLATLFVVGALRSLVTVDRWWAAGLEMFGLGVVVAGAAYLSGSLVAGVVG